MEKAHYVPPPPNQVMEHLDNWEKYYHLERPDPLVQLAVVHAQFEIIHPFIDGNGRLGRMIIPLFLYEKKLLTRPMFYLSAYLEAHRKLYYERLRALGHSEQAWNAWIEFFLHALDEQAKLNASKSIAIMELYNDLKHKAIELTHSQYAVPILDQLFRQPIRAGSSLIGIRGLPTKPVIMSILGKLKSAGILKTVREGSGRRPQIYALADLVNLCEGRKAI